MEDMKLSIFILGTTAVGKTKLSLQLCKHLNGQIISCDSKQLYKYANLMTAKSTVQELKMFKHNMVDCLELEEASYNRNKFYQQVKQHTKRIWHEGKTPIFIGGTNYYIEPILFNVQNLGKLQDEDITKTKVKHQGQIQQKKHKQTILQRQDKISQIKFLSKEQKYKRLKQVDPVMAERLHKNDQNRITSCLYRYYRDNQKPSQKYKPYTNQLNNQNTILFWVRNTDRLEHRIVVEQRIKEMLGKDGILQILSVFMYLDIYYSKGQQNKDLVNDKQNDKQKLLKKLTASGIGQSIGYKEFFYFYYQFKEKLFNSEKEQKIQEILILYHQKNPDYQKIYNLLNQNYEKIQKSFLNFTLLEQAQQQLINDTWAYCKRQITWIRNRIFQKDQILTKRFYILDLAKRQRKYSNNNQQDLQNLQQQKKTYDKKDMMQRFDKNVKQKAINIIDQIKQNSFDSCYEKYQVHEQQFKQMKQQIKLQQWKKYECKECNIEINGPIDWKQHINSKKHIKRVKYLQKKDEIDKWIEYRKKKEEESTKMKESKIDQNKQQQEK